MKKLLGLLAATGLVATSGITAVVSCGTNDIYSKPDGAFKLSTNKFDIHNSTSYSKGVAIENYSILNDEALPSLFEYSEPNIIEVSLNKAQKSLIFRVLEANEELIDKTITITIKQAQNKHSQTVEATIKNLTETEFALESNDVEFNSNTINVIKISNFDILPDNTYYPSTVSFDTPDFASAEIDLPNKEIIVRTNGKATNNLTLTVSDENNNVTRNVKVKIIKQIIDLGSDDADYETRILAGNMKDGVIIPDQVLGQDDSYVITKESIITSFNIANNLNLTLEDIDINVVDTDFEGKGMGSVWEISSKSSSVTGSIEVITNREIAPSSIMNKWDVGEVRIFEEYYDDLEEILEANPESDTRPLALIAQLLENVGSRNKSMEYLKPIFFAPLGLAESLRMSFESRMSKTSFKLAFQEFGGIFVKEDLEFTFTFVKEDRITFLDGWDSKSKVEVDRDLLDGGMFDVEKREVIQQKVYDELMSEDFRQKVGFATFKEFTRIKKARQDYYFDILPGSSSLYGHDALAYGFFIASQDKKYEPKDKKYIDAINIRFDIF
ncbi:hypothetical protein SCLARK_001764 [Spiroplasma clarkii]|uniref:Lipoprotein n=1 Tax=Spiroplasma clarkii TaxID=2139 RepID=A0A1Y0L2J9_9MOLU|nr:hypothetical protein [Spiroplasma clarkii]ARU92217.1 hypothetical protein SCLARK_001764 [Spiroplasma clarkii]ATX71536.1 hypothetical protein SCLAR_v1c12360 [Spiroplasma clarkii]